MAFVLSTRTLWYLVFGLLGVSGVLVVGSFNYGWFTVRYEGGLDVEGRFFFEEYTLFLLDGGEADELLTRDYDPNFEFSSVMDVTSLLWTGGLIALVVYAATLAAHYVGVMRSVKPIFLAWLLMAALLGGGFLFFTVRAGPAADADIEYLAALYAEQEIDAHVGFWGEQPIQDLNTTLHSRPGAGWWLGLLGLANVVGSNLLLLRFPKSSLATSKPG